MNSLLKFVTALLLTALLAFLGGLVLPWWIIAVVAFIVAVIIPQRPGIHFLSGFLALFLLWGGMALVFNMQNQGILASKIAAVLPLGGSAMALVLVTAVVGALVAGLAALSGSFVRKY